MRKDVKYYKKLDEYINNQGIDFTLIMKKLKQEALSLEDLQIIMVLIEVEKIKKKIHLKGVIATLTCMRGV